MIRTQFLLATLLVVTVLTQTVLTQEGAHGGVKSLLTASTQGNSKSSQTVPQSQQSEETESAEEQRIQAEIAEIMAIRKRLGGGVSEQLKGLSIEMPGQNTSQGQAPDAKEEINLEEAFAKQLAEQTRNSHAADPATTERQWHLETVAEGSAMPAPERRETVRHAARLLEEAAAMLEEASEYQQADKVRRTAGELWRTARRQ